jgi:hypothetical protein
MIARSIVSINSNYLQNTFEYLSLIGKYHFLLIRKPFFFICQCKYFFFKLLCIIFISELSSLRFFLLSKDGLQSKVDFSLGLSLPLYFIFFTSYLFRLSLSHYSNVCYDSLRKLTAQTSFLNSTSSNLVSVFSPM